jgi:hypothetical protein
MTPRGRQLRQQIIRTLCATDAAPEVLTDFMKNTKPDEVDDLVDRCMELTPEDRAELVSMLSEADATDKKPRRFTRAKDSKRRKARDEDMPDEGEDEEEYGAGPFPFPGKPETYKGAEGEDKRHAVDAAPRRSLRFDDMFPGARGISTYER